MPHKLQGTWSLRLCSHNWTSWQDARAQVNWSAATCLFFFFTIHSLNLYIFNDHITVSLNINYAWGNCYLVHITLTQTPVWESRCKDEFLWIRNTYIQAIPATLCFWNYINLFRHSFHRILKAAKYCITNWQLSRGKCGGKWQDY